MTQQFIGIKKVTAWPQDKENKPGYAVKYEDGYISWSPKDAFESAYIPIDPDFNVTLAITTKSCKKPAKQA